MTDGGPAFPIPAYKSEYDVLVAPYGGMSVRTYLVGQCLVGLLAGAAGQPPVVNGRTMSFDEAAVAIADATIERLGI